VSSSGGGRGQAPSRSLVARFPTLRSLGHIDHVILGLTDAFAVETKGRLKQSRGSGKACGTVRHDGKALKFSDRRETKPVEQANRTAAWLAKAVGEPVPVRAVLLLPGWWVERAGRGDVLVGNAKEIGRVVAPNRNMPSSGSSLQTRIVHQLDQCRRNIEPRRARARGHYRRDRNQRLRPSLIRPK